MKPPVFLIGDRVRLVDHRDMETPIGNVLTVDHVFEKDAYCVRGDPEDTHFEAHWYPMSRLVKVTDE